MNRKLIQNFASLASLQIISALFGIITIPLLIDVLTLGGFGEFSVIFSIVTLASIVIDFGVSNSGVRQVVNRKNIEDELASYIYSVFFLRNIIFIIYAIIFLVFLWLTDFSISYFTFIIFVYSFVIQMNYYFKAIQKMWVLTVATFTQRAGVLILLIVMPPTLDSALLAYSVPYIIVNLIVFISVIKKIHRPREIILVNVFFDSLNMFTGVFGSTLYRYLTLPILSIVFTQEVIGVYSALEKVYKGVQGIFNSIAESIYPVICGGGKLGLSHTKLILFVTSLSFLAFLSMSIIIESNYAYFGLEKVDHFITILTIMLFSFVLGIVNYLVGVTHFFSVGRHFVFSKVVIIGGILSLGYLLLFYFIESYFMLFSTLLTELIIFIMLCNCIRCENEA